MNFDEVEQSQRPWRWATENGELRAGSEWELVRQLASGEVPPYVLVWRVGWAEWLPAMQVSELAVAFPTGGAVLKAARASTRPGSVPPVPVSEYPRLRLLARQASLGLATEFECPEHDVITSEVPAAVMQEAARVMTEPSPPADLGLDMAVTRASQRPGPVAPFGSLEVQPSGFVSGPALPLAAEFGLQGLIDAETPKHGGWPFWLRAHGLWIALGALLLGLAGLFTARWLAASHDPLSGAAGGFLGRSRADAQRQLSQSSRELPVLACQIKKEPVKLDDWAVVDVRPSLMPLPGSQTVALGYAQSHKQAIGGVLDLTTLELERTFGQQHERQIFSVSPLGATGAISYHVERMGALVALGRALDTVPTLRVGMNDDGIVLGPVDQRSERVWELPVGTLISVPEIAAHELGFTLATRAGRATGHLRLGLLSLTGATLSALEQLGTLESEFGRPALVSGSEQTVLAVAQRVPDGGHSMLLARAKNGQLPLELEPLDISSSADVELSAPALAALPDGGFALMWSQGSGGQRQVRVQRLSSTLVPLGAPLDVSTPDPTLGGATAGALQWVGGRLVAFYFVRRGEGYSLWVGSLSCGA